ncbi:glucosamine-6-phosphate deaminase [Flavitalea sp. BT771]|uniref:glucosamine-6-phosphate deaminase n=1 Tax=Flavitalea sp. BT771 TaxID=3063329 RepID=UPI0026E48BDF|nr:glucosamine-6-phosphate deaminase [Flavitalea sp. BT771]MDO6429341.1 glucosamine-6-phosphate deaminase [Flavitalea sp. BT771]MDV6218531.1 glucosamine-6-phosphate deaminase [Flavitalea sp. BT771]
MKVHVEKNAKGLGIAAGKAAAALIADAIGQKGQANIILGTGASQFETLRQLTASKDIEWNKVVMFHLDEYIGLPVTHPASFRKYLKERFLDKVPLLKAYHLINGDTDPEEECRRLGALISAHPIDVALAGVGENGHLAFNDPPADFETTQPYIIAHLDEACRMQQLGEGWFKSIDEVPPTAISMSVQQLMKSKHIICSVPDQRKAKALKDSFEQPVSNIYPASILRRHPDCQFFLDVFSVSMLSRDASAYEHLIEK